MYIDPPYNTEKSSEEGNSNNSFSDEKETKNNSGKFVYRDKFARTGWLNLMNDRLLKAKELLKDDGVIFVSIDDNEQAYLKVLMDEIFGEENFISNISVINNLGGRSDEINFATANEYLLVYAKNHNYLKINGLEISEDIIDKEYKYNDENGLYKKISFIKTGNESNRENRPNMFYPILAKNNSLFSITQEEFDSLYIDGKFNDLFLETLIQKYESLDYKVFLPKDKNGNFKRWRWGFETYNKEILMYPSNIILDNNSVKTKIRATLENGSIKQLKNKTVWYKSTYSTNSGTTLLNTILNNNKFPFPKSLDFLKDLLLIHTNKNAKILDFFSGSATTAHAVWELNRQDGGNRTFTIVTNNENNIAFDTTYERLHRISKGVSTDGKNDFDWLKKNEPYHKDFEVYETQQFKVDINQKNLDEPLNLLEKELRELSLMEDYTKEELLIKMRDLYSFKKEEKDGTN
ncbi:site-specific DNA-methyltransferase [[Mycoplasma] gypis]|uniref:Site-specific DNA-methyltransferase n=1 Tax=[Mycoplasma] gypis TaxID=92404 RepID=A0ABZ2RP11_9BACT